MIDGKFTLKIEDIAASLSSEDADVQAKFFNTFFKALRIDCETSFRLDCQLCNIYSDLDERSKKYIKFLTFDED